MYIKKVYNLVSILPSIFLFSFFIFFGLTAVVIFFELIAFSLLLPFLTMLSNNSIDLSTFPVSISILNDFFQNNFQINFLNNIKNITLIIFFTFLIKILFQFILTWVTAKISINAQHFYAVKLYNSYLNKDYKFHQKNSSSTLFRNITVEINNFTSVILFQLMSVFVEVSIILSIFIFIFFVEPKIIIIVFLLIALIGLIYISSKKILKLYGDKRIFFEDKRIATIQNSFEIIKDIIVYDISKIFSENFKYSNFNLQKANFVVKIFNSLPRYLLEFTGVLILVLTIFIFSENDEGNSFQIIGIFLLAAFRAMPSISKISATFQSLIFMKPSLNIIHNELSQNIRKKQFKKKNIDLIQFNKQILLKNIFYTYPSLNNFAKSNLLNNINAIFSKGDKVGIEGESGFGKSTLADILLGLVQPDKGYIKVDNEKINLKNSYKWRNKIGYVGQKVTLLNGGIKENIILEKKFNKIIFSQIIRKCKLTALYNKRKKDSNLASQMTNKISGGESQRIGIARALYQNPDVLVLDEATNALDQKTEKEILKYIYSLNKSTVFIIAHNKRALFGCNKFVKFTKKGKIVLINEKKSS